MDDSAFARSGGVNRDAKRQRGDWMLTWQGVHRGLVVPRRLVVELVCIVD